MICLVIFAFFLTVLANEIPSELQASCSPYIDACNAQTSVSSTDRTPCSQVFDENACSGRTKENYWECISLEFDVSRLALTLEAEALEACFYEESKALETYSFYKSTIINRKITKRIVPSSQEFDDLSLTSFTFKSGDTIPKNRPYLIDINVNYGSLDVQRGYWDDMPYHREIPHINLHACKMTSTQTTCSAKFYESPDVPQSAWDFNGDPGLREEQLNLTSTGNWRIMGHIFYFTGGPCTSDADGCEQIRWDISVAKAIQVTDNSYTQDDGSAMSTSFLFAFLLAFYNF